MTELFINPNGGGSFSMAQDICGACLGSVRVSWEGERICIGVDAANVKSVAWEIIGEMFDGRILPSGVDISEMRIEL